MGHAAPSRAARKRANKKAKDTPGKGKGTGRKMLDPNIDPASPTDGAGNCKRWICGRGCLSKGGLLFHNPAGTPKCQICGVAPPDKGYVPNTGQPLPAATAKGGAQPWSAVIQETVTATMEAAAAKAAALWKSPPPPPPPKAQAAVQQPQYTPDEREHRKKLSATIGKIDKALAALDPEDDAAIIATKRAQKEAILSELRQGQPIETQRAGINDRINRAAAKKAELEASALLTAQTIADLQSELVDTKQQVGECEATLIKERQNLALLPVAPGQPSEADLAESQTLQSLFNAKFPHLANAADDPQAALLAKTFFNAAKEMEAAELALRNARLQQLEQQAQAAAKEAADVATARASASANRNMLDASLSERGPVLPSTVGSAAPALSSDFGIDPAEVEAFCQQHGFAKATALQHFIKGQLDKKAMAADGRSQPYSAPPAN